MKARPPSSALTFSMGENTMDEDEQEEKDELEELKDRLREAEAHLYLARLGLKT